jgi:hypothetical protein
MSGRMRTKRKLRALLWFLLWIAFFSLAFTPAYWFADALLLAALVTGMIVFTGAKIHKLWKYRSDPQMREAHTSSGQGGVFGNDRWRRWALDDHEDKGN